MEWCDQSLDSYIGQIASGSNGVADSSWKQIIVGLEHLHRVGIVHRNVKPSNILVITPSNNIDKGPIFKVADFNRSKYRSIGWTAPEVSQESFEETGAVDVFAAGCVIHYGCTYGKHPFSPTKNTDLNLPQFQFKINMLETSNLQPAGQQQSAFEHLISWMIKHSPGDRPKFHEILSHPFFWSVKETVDFIRELSASLENQPQKDKTLHQKQIIKILEDASTKVFDKDWKKELTPIIANTFKSSKAYNESSVYDLLRAIRNKVGLQYIYWCH